MRPRVGTSAVVEKPASETNGFKVETLESDRAAELFPDEQNRLSLAERQEMVRDWKRAIRSHGGRRGDVLVLTSSTRLGEQVFKGLVKQALDELGFNGPARYTSPGPYQLAAKLPGRRRGPMPNVD